MTPAAPVTVRRVATARDLREFVGFPWRLYNAREHPQWVPPLRASVLDALDEKNNPFYQDAARELFLAYRSDELVGRIAAIENRAHNRFHADRSGFFGFFESVNDQDVASALFDAASAWLGARGLESMCGPFNPSTNYECGMLVEGFENRPTFMTAWNPPWYNTLCAGAGLTKAKDLLGLWFDIGRAGFEAPEILERHAARAAEKGGITFRDIDPSRFEKEVELCWDIYNNAWERNWGFVPMEHAEFHHMAKDMKFLVWKELSFMAYVNGEPAGFMFALPDYNVVLQHNRGGRLFPLGLARMLLYKRRAKTARVIALGVKSSFRSRTILAVFTREIMRRGLGINGEGAEASWLLEDNQLIVKPMRALGATDRMRWRLYEREVRAL
jgi:hypothetical protein